MIRFLADDHLAKLARWLRLLGHDTLYFAEIEDARLAELAAGEGRVVLTRDTTLARRFPKIDVFRIEDEDPFEQLTAVIRKFELDCASHIFSRCMLCNALLQPIDKETFREQIPAEAFERCSQFARCTGCEKIYWDGTHYIRMKKRIEEISKSA